MQQRHLRRPKTDTAQLQLDAAENRVVADGGISDLDHPPAGGNREWHVSRHFVGVSHGGGAGGGADIFSIRHRQAPSRRGSGLGADEQHGISLPAMKRIYAKGSEDHTSE